MTGPEDDFTKPSMRRVYDYWLGGRDNFAADREQAHRIEAAYPPLPAGQVPVPRRNVRAGRAFLERAVAWTAGQGVAQFAQLAAGPPAPPQYPPLHEVARRERPGARWAYTDADPVTASIIRAFTAGQDVAVIEGDAREPDVILKLLGEAVDLDMPTGVILAMGLQMLPLEQARELAAAYVAALVPGSYLVLTCPTCTDPELWERLQSARTAGRACRAWNHSPADIEAFFSGTELVPPGLVMARAWKPARGPVGLRPDAASHILAGVGRKP